MHQVDGTWMLMFLHKVITCQYCVHLLAEMLHTPTIVGFICRSATQLTLPLERASIRRLPQSSHFADYRDGTIQQNRAEVSINEVHRRNSSWQHVLRSISWLESMSVTCRCETALMKIKHVYRWSTDIEKVRAGMDRWGQWSIFTEF